MEQPNKKEKNQDYAKQYQEHFGKFVPNNGVNNSRVSTFEIFTMFKPSKQEYSTGVSSGSVIR